MLSKTNLFHESNIRDGTNIASGINLALSKFTPSTSNSKSIILVSDGKTTKNQIKQVIEAANKHKQKVKVFAIAVGKQKDTDMAVLKELANSTGGQFYHIDEMQKIHEAYQVIIDAILCETVIPDNSCLAANSLFTDVEVEIRRTNVIMIAILNIGCSDVEKVSVRYNTVNGEYEYDLVSRGQNVYRTVKPIDRFEDFVLDKEVEFRAYDV